VTDGLEPLCLPYVGVVTVGGIEPPSGVLSSLPSQFLLEPGLSHLSLQLPRIARRFRLITVSPRGEDSNLRWQI
jgi:hypothetical protein